MVNSPARGVMAVPLSVRVVSLPGFTPVMFASNLPGEEVKNGCTPTNETTGPESDMVITIGAEMVTAPMSSMALALNVYVPAAMLASV